MGVLLRYTLASLKKNRARTAVAVLGILLSMTLFTAVLAGAYSGLSWLRENEETKNGRWQGLYFDLNEEETAQVLSRDYVRDSLVWRTLGWARLDNENEFKPYLLIQSADEDPEGLSAIRLISGRMPQNENELILPENLITAGGVQITEGDVLPLQVGRRMAEDGQLGTDFGYMPEMHETLQDCAEKRYTVVGIYERLSFDLEPFSCPGYTAITAGSTAAAEYSTVLFTVDRPGSFYELTEGDRGLLGNRLRSHRELLLFSAEARDSGLVAVLVGLTAILLVLIVFGSVSLIYNSFSISVSERLKSFGVLRSVGATRKQVRLSVLLESLILCAVGIPAGMGLGLLGLSAVLRYLRDDFTAVFGGYADSVPIHVTVSPGILLLAAGLCLLTTLVSAAIPAGKAVRASAIDVIRETDEVRNRTPRGGAVSGKLFGFGGTLAGRNYARSRRRYRITILSLALSLVLFISATSFVDYLKSYVNTYTAGLPRADLSCGTAQAGVGQSADVLNGLRALPHVDSCSAVTGAYAELYLSAGDCTDEALTQNPGQSETAVCMYGVLEFADEQSFRKLCEENGLNEADYTDPAALRAVAVNHIDGRTYENGAYRYYSYDVFKDAGGGQTVTFYDAAVQPDLIFDYVSVTEDGPTAYYSEIPGAETDVPKQVSLTETVREITVTVGAAVPARQYWDMDSGDSFTLIFPVSAMERLFGADSAAAGIFVSEYSILAADHKAAEEEMKQFLDDQGQYGYIRNQAAHNESFRMALKILRVFSYCFILLMALISAANVYNTISTNIRLRRREFAVLKSVGMGNRDFSRMMRCECLLYISRSLVLGLTLAFAFTYAIYVVVGQSLTSAFYVPWISVAAACAGVVLIVFLTAGRAAGELNRRELAEELRREIT